MSPDRHREVPVTVRFGPDRERLENYAERTGKRVHRAIRDFVREGLDEAETDPEALADYLDELAAPETPKDPS
jgi:predicted DNA-binding protein